MDIPGLAVNAEHRIAVIADLAVPEPAFTFLPHVCPEAIEEP